LKNKNKNDFAVNNQPVSQIFFWWGRGKTKPNERKKGYIGRKY